MITVLIALGAGVGGVLLGCGYSIWRVSRQRTIIARRVEPYVLPKTAQPGGVVIGVDVRAAAERFGQAAGLSGQTAKEYAEHAMRRFALQPPPPASTGQLAAERSRLLAEQERLLAAGVPIEHLERIHDASADYDPHGLDSFDVAPAVPYPHPVSAVHPPTDIND